MKVPKALYGTAREVSKRMRTLVKECRRGADFRALDWGETIDTFDVRDSGIWGRSDGYPLLLLDPGFKQAGDPPVLHCYAFFSEIVTAVSDDKMTREKLDAAVAWSLQEPWSFLGLMGQSGSLFLGGIDVERHRQWRATGVRAECPWHQLLFSYGLLWFDFFEAEGPRFSRGAPMAELFSMTPTLLHIALRYEGFAMEPSPLVPGRTKALLELANQKSREA